MKICFLNHDTRSNTGAGQFYNALSREVKKAIAGVEVEILTSENLLYPNKIKLLLALPVIRKIFKRCDVIHALDGWPYGVIGAMASLGLKKRFIITAIGTGAIQSLYRPLKHWLMKWAYKKADQVVAVSKNTKKEILKFLPELKIEVINHGVDFEKYNSRSSNYQAEAKKSQPYLLSVGALKKRKGYEYSIRAFAEASKKFPDLNYIIVGSGSEKENLESLIRNLGLTNRVKFLTDVQWDFLTALYQNAELFILLPQDVNKDMEGFGLVFLEAAAAGLPVVATRETSAEDAVLSGKNGFLVSPRNVEEAGQAIIKILSNRGLREEFSKNSVEFAKSMNWQKVANLYARIYERVLRTTE